MFKPEQDLLNTLEQYLDLIESALSNAGSTAEDDKIYLWHGEPAASEDELHVVRGEIELLIKYVGFCRDEGNSIALEMANVMDRTARAIAHATFSSYRPLIARGQKVGSTIKRIQRDTYGNPDERDAKYNQWQVFIDAEYRKDPHKTYGALQLLAANKFGVGKSTIEKRTTNPKKK